MGSHGLVVFILACKPEARVQIQAKKKNILLVNAYHFVILVQVKVNNISIQRARPSGNIELSQTHLAISTHRKHSEKLFQSI